MAFNAEGINGQHQVTLNVINVIANRQDNLNVTLGTDMKANLASQVTIKVTSQFLTNRFLNLTINNELHQTFHEGFDLTLQVDLGVPDARTTLSKIINLFLSSTILFSKPERSPTNAHSVLPTPPEFRG
jgi:predicted 2-oxoglutarate/Fe(II)-dependent dioxygenase YbiX